MGQVVGQLLLQVRRTRVDHALRSGCQQVESLGIPGFLEEKCSRHRGFQGPLIALAPSRTIEGNSCSQHQLTVLGSKHARGHPDPKSGMQIRQPGDPGQPIPLHRRIEVPHEGDIDIADRFRFRFLEPLPAQPVQHCRNNRGRQSGLA